MSTLVLKNLPEPLHERLKAKARQNHRSLNREAIALLEQGLLAPAEASDCGGLPPLVRLPGGPLTAEWVEQATARGRR